MRFDDRVTGKFEEFCKHGTIVHIDIDHSEHNKNRKVQLPIISDIKYALRRLNQMLRERTALKPFTAWHKQIAAWKTRAPFGYTVTEEVMKKIIAGSTKKAFLDSNLKAFDLGKETAQKVMKG